MRLPRLDLDALNRRYGHWLSLALGGVTLLWVRRGVEFAPYASLILLTAWSLALLLGWLGPGPAQRSASPLVPGDQPAGPPQSGEARWRRWLRQGAGTGSVSLYQNVLFFLLPLWFGAATWRSANILFPLLLGGMALFSCFEYSYREYVLDRPVIRAAFSGVILFSALVLVGPLVTFTSHRHYLPIAAGLAALVAWLSLALPQRAAGSGVASPTSAGPPPAVGRRPGWLRVRRGLTLLCVVGLVGGLAWFLPPLLPPWPIQGLRQGTGTGLDRHLNLTGLRDTFPVGTQRLHAWFSVAAPDRYRQPVVFEWYRDRQRVRVFRAAVVGNGGRMGYRTWDWINVWQSGDWYVDLRTEEGGLIGRCFFRVR